MAKSSLFACHKSDDLAIITIDIFGGYFLTQTLPQTQKQTQVKKTHITKVLLQAKKDQN